MKTYKKLATWSFVIGGLTLFVWGSMNSQVLDKNAFMQNKYNIKFAKRLDEMNGKLVEGRMAASVDSSKWSKLTTASIKKTIKKLETPKKQEVAKSVETPRSEPAIKDADLILTGGLFNKKPLKDKSAFNGEAKIVDGVLERVDLTLPGGVSVQLSPSNERLNGNVFTYEDTETGEARSGLVYMVKKGVYMATLTNDTNFAGLRLEFKTETLLAELSRKQEESWAYNDVADQDDSQQTKQANNDVQENINENTDQQEAGSFGFNFQV